MYVDTDHTDDNSSIDAYIHIYLYKNSCCYNI